MHDDFGLEDDGPFSEEFAEFDGRDNDLLGFLAGDFAAVTDFLVDLLGL